MTKQQQQPKQQPQRVAAEPKGKSLVEASVEFRQDGTTAIILPADFQSALIGGDLYISATGKTATPVHIPAFDLPVEREDGDIVSYRCQLTVGISTTPKAAPQILRR